MHSPPRPCDRPSGDRSGCFGSRGARIDSFIQERHRRTIGAGRYASVLTAVALVGLAACSARLGAPQPPPRSYQRAEDAFRLGEYDQAVAGYREFLGTGQSPEVVARAFYRLALAEFRRGRYEDCLAVLDEMQARFPQRRWPRVYALRGQAEEARGNSVSAVRWWELEWLADTTDRKPAARERIANALARMDETALTAARSVLTTAEMRGLVDARLDQGPLTRPEDHAGDRVPDPSTPAGAQPATGADPAPRIGCLLPLSGPYAVYGQRSLNGIRLALDTRAEQLVVRDTRGTAEAATAAMEGLIAAPGVVAVIGPLRSRVAEAVAPLAEQAGLPMIALSQREGISGSFVIQPTMTDERQAAALAEYAVGVLGLHRFGVLYPQDRYGEALSQAFREQVQRRQGEVVGALAYVPGGHEFTPEVLSVQKWIDDDGMQAVFLPDFAGTAVALGTAVRRAQPGVVLFGSNGWHDPALLGEADELDDVIFVDGFFAGSRRPSTQRFVVAYWDAYHAYPEILEAQAYDAALLVSSALESGVRTRAQVVPALHNLRTVEGAAGTIGIGPGGVQRELFLLRLNGGTITEVVAEQPTTITAEPTAPLAAPERMQREPGLPVLPRED